MIKQLNLWKNVRYLFMRYLMICVFMFMCVILISMKPGILGPVFGVFYFVALLYYFWFTMKTEGQLDVNRVRIGQMPYFRWKGAVCALILAVPLMILNLVPNFFPEARNQEYMTYFTGEVTTLSEDANFNRDLRDKSGKGGYVSEILFQTSGDIDQLIYVTTNGFYIKCDGTVNDENLTYAAAEEPLSLSSKNENVVYYTEDAELSDAQSEAFAECKNAIDDIAEVMGKTPNYQRVFAVIKVVFAMALQYFCQIFAGKDNVMLASVVYCISMLVLCVAAQVGYEMGYRNIEILSRRKPKKNDLAGDSVTVQGRKDGQ